MPQAARTSKSRGATIPAPFMLAVVFFGIGFAVYSPNDSVAVRFAAIANAFAITSIFWGIYTILKVQFSERVSSSENAGE